MKKSKLAKKGLALVLIAAMSLNFSVPVLAENTEESQSEEIFEDGSDSQSVIAEDDSLGNENAENDISDEEDIDEVMTDESNDGNVSEELPYDCFVSESEEENYDDISYEESDIEDELSAIALYAATSGKCGENVNWSYSYGILEITGTGAMQDYSRWGAAPWYSYRQQITKIKLSEGITYIGEYAFCSTNCRAIDLPSTLTGIGYNSLVLDNITSIEIPQSLTDITNLSWIRMPKLENISVAAGNKIFSAIDGVLFSGKTLVHYPCAKSGSSYTVPDGITVLESGTFKNASNLKQIILPDSLSKIGDYAFCDATCLTEISIPAEVTELGSQLFYGCSVLAKLTFLGASQLYAESTAFDGCSVKTIYGFDNASIYYKSGRKTETLTDLAKKLNASYVSLGYAGGETESYSWILNKAGELRFTPKQRCPVTNPYCLDTYGRINKIVIEDGFTSISQNAFQGLRNLTEVVIPKSVTVIEHDVFANCQNLKEIHLPDSIKEIGSGAFAKCSSLESITIPNSVLTMGVSVFEECTELTTVTLSENLTEIPETTFLYCSKLSEIKIPEKVEIIGNSAFAWTNLNNIDISNNVKEIKDYAFRGIPSVIQVWIPKGVEKLGEGVFRGCTKLKTVGIPSSVIEIGTSAFSGCTALTNINVDYNNKNYVSYNGALYTKDKTILQAFPAGNTGSCTVPDGCKVIATNAFAYSKLTEIILPDGVTSILDGAFSHCSELTEI